MRFFTDGETVYRSRYGVGGPYFRRRGRHCPQRPAALILPLITVISISRLAAFVRQKQCSHFKSFRSRRPRPASRRLMLMPRSRPCGPKRTAPDLPPQNPPHKPPQPVHKAGKDRAVVFTPLPGCGRVLFLPKPEPFGFCE